MNGRLKLGGAKAARGIGFCVILFGARSTSYQMVGNAKRFRECGFADDRLDALENDPSKLLGTLFAALTGCDMRRPNCTTGRLPKH
jgi:hypothetical protein